MAYNIIPSTNFKKSLKKYLKSSIKKEAIKDVINLLAENGYKAIPSKMLPHKLKGNYKGLLGMSYSTRFTFNLGTGRRTRKGYFIN